MNWAFGVSVVLLIGCFVGDLYSAKREAARNARWHKRRQNRYLIGCECERCKIVKANGGKGVWHRDEEGRFM